MGDESTRQCIACEGQLSPIILMDRYYINSSYTQSLEYRRPDDSRSFWTGKYPTAGAVEAYLCGECGRIELFGKVGSPATAE